MTPPLDTLPETVFIFAGNGPTTLAMIPRHPKWIRSELPSATALARVSQVTYMKGISTVCREARCPNQGECFAKSTATFLILGPTCTRACRFCAVDHGSPTSPSPEEPYLVASAVESLGLTHAVVTSVTRDDLPDGGASVFAATIKAVRRRCPDTTIEVLVPDFEGSEESLHTVLDARPDVLNHNLETVPRLYTSLRPAASYARSLDLLNRARRHSPNLVTKSGIMLGVGETREEVTELVEDLVRVGCRGLTIGQYLQPTPNHYPVHRFIEPYEFTELRNLALRQGMQYVAAGALVRSSYRAGEAFLEMTKSNLR